MARCRRKIANIHPSIHQLTHSPSISPSNHSRVHLYRPPVCPSILPPPILIHSVLQPFHRPVHPSNHAHICPSIHPVSHIPTSPRDFDKSLAHPSSHLSICPSTHPSIRPLTCQYIHPSIHLPIHPFTYPAFRPYTHLTVHLSIRPFTYPSLSLSPFTYPSMHPSTCSSICALHLWRNLELFVSNLTKDVWTFILSYLATQMRSNQSPVQTQ